MAKRRLVVLGQDKKFAAADLLPGDTLVIFTDYIDSAQCDRIKKGLERNGVTGIAILGLPQDARLAVLHKAVKKYEDKFWGPGGALEKAVTERKP